MWIYTYLKLKVQFKKWNLLKCLKKKQKPGSLCLLTWSWLILWQSRDLDSGIFFYPFRTLVQLNGNIYIWVSEWVSEVAQSCPTLCDPVDCSLSGSSVHGIFQARVLEWIAISFSRGSSRPRNRTRVSCIAGRRFTVWATREAPYSIEIQVFFFTCYTLWTVIIRKWLQSSVLCNMSLLFVLYIVVCIS